MKRKIFPALLALCLVVGLLPLPVQAAEVASGTCGAGLTWSLDDSGTLTISGTGRMEDYDSNTLPWRDHFRDITTVEIQNGVTSIGDRAFISHSFSSISIPESVTSIGYQAFLECIALTDVFIPEGVTSIGALAFGSSALTSISIPESVTSIGRDAFNGCADLETVTIPQGITSIEDGLFLRCSRLTSVTIPEGVTSIGDGAFAECKALASVSIPEGVTSIGDSAFRYCNALASVSIPESVTSIEEYAFSNCGITSISIPEGVTSIEYCTFGNCGYLTNVDIPSSVTSIGDSAFTLCNALASVSIPEGVTSIGRSAFSGCLALTDISIPESVTSIGRSAFSYCENLKNVYYWGDASQWEAVTVGDNNTALTEDADIYYPGTATLAFSPETMEAGAADPVLTITSDRPFAPLSGRAALGYVEVDPGGTGLTPVGAALDANDRKIMTVSFSGTSSGGNISITIPTEGFAGPVNFTSGAVLTVTADSPADPDPAPNPEPSRPSSSGQDRSPAAPAAPTKPTTVQVDDSIHTSEQEKIVISGQGESDMQSMVKSGEFVSWIDRVNLPQYALNLYEVLCIGGDHDRLYDILIQDEYNTVSGGGSGNENADVESVLELVGHLDRPYASGGGAFSAGSLTGGFDIIDTTAGDRSIRYEDLKEGDVVRTSAYNAIYVTKVAKDNGQSYDENLKAACTYATTAFQAFDRDHPEVFWLSGSSKLRMVTVTMRSGNQTYKETYILFVLADADGFTVRDPKYPNQAAVESGIQRRDRAVAEILETVTGTSASERVTQLNRWLTEHNHYNTSPDLQNLPNAPHECLSALEGNVGADGPVCDGYSRAFKVLCDKLGIPCVLVDGYALAKAGGPGEFHMWNSVQMPDGQWYGVDVTWNDPTVKGVETAKSGREREDFLLVGADTVVFGLKFSESHPPKNRAANGGVSFINGPTLSAAAFNPLAGAASLPFTDVDEDSWCYDAVGYVFDKGLMKGTSGWEFSPDRPVTRAMVWTILARLSGENTEGGTPWYAAAQSWAVREEISDGTGPDALVTRQQLAAMLWRYAGSPASGGSLERFTDSRAVSGYAADAMRWAVENGIVSGKSDGSLQPDGTASRAHVAAMIERFCKTQENEAVN